MRFTLRVMLGFGCVLACCAALALPLSSGAKKSKCDMYTKQSELSEKQRRRWQQFHAGCESACVKSAPTSQSRMWGNHWNKRDPGLQFFRNESGYFMKVAVPLTKMPSVNYGSADVLIRTTDPLVFRFEDDTEIETYPLCDLGATRRLCGFYELPEELLQALASKQVTAIRQVVTRLDSDRNRKIETTEEGREHFDWDRLTGPDWKKKVPGTAKCAL